MIFSILLKACLSRTNPFWSSVIILVYEFQSFLAKALHNIFVSQDMSEIGR